MRPRYGIYFQKRGDARSGATALNAPTTTAIEPKLAKPHTSAVLNQIVLARAVSLYIGQQLGHHIQLVIPGKNHPLGLYLAGLFVPLLLQVKVFM